MKKINQVMVMLLAMMLVFAGCRSNTPSDDGYSNETVPAETAPARTEEGADSTEAILSYEGELQFVGLAEDFSVAYKDIYAMESMTTEVKHISSSGEVSEQTVTGVKLEDILKAHGATKNDYSSIRFTAGDGYAVSMPAEVFSAKDVILAWAFDGEPLDDKKMPLRVAVHDERSMYYVSNLVEVAFEQGGETEVDAGGNRVVLMESAFTTLETEDYMYYDSNDLAVSAKAMMKAFTSSKGENVAFVASDGYEKTELYDVVKDGYIKINGEDAPLFTGEEVPKGMNVKYIMTMAVADATFVSVNSSVDVIENVSFDGDSGVNLAELVKLAGLEADTYLITATDGYAKEVTQDQLETGMAYVNNSETVTIKFDDGDSKKSKIKNALTIASASGGAPVQEAADETAVEEAAGDMWVVTFEGLSDGSFDFDQERAERKMEKVSLHTAKMKDDVVKEEDWEGYRVLDILSWLKVEDFNSIVVVAGDGYEVELVKAQVDEETILADVKNGEPMTDADNLVQLVQNTEFATSWVKGVARIIVK